MFNRIGVSLPLLMVLGSACGGCEPDAVPWMLDEPASATPTSSDAPSSGVEVLVTDASVCERNREHIRGLGIVDEATLQRRPVGEVVEIWADWGADGVIEACSLRLFDGDGLEVVHLVDFDSERGPQRVYWKREYDVVAGHPGSTLADVDGDGVWDHESGAAFDEFGNYVWSTHDDGVDGTIEHRASFFYDERGHRTRQERDDADDGIVDAFTDFVTDQSGRYVQWDADHDADGQWDRQLRWTFEPGQNTYVQIDHTYGTREFAVEFLDDRGRVARTESDRGDDGTIDYIIDVEWEGDTATTRHDFEADGVADNIERHAWHRVGGELKHGLIHDDFDNDGQWDQIREHIYDGDGNLLRFQSYDPSTGDLAFRQTYVRR